MPKPKVIVFDFDGVIIDSNDFGLRQFIKVFPKITADDYKNLLRGNFRDGVDKLTLEKIPETEEEKEARRAQANLEKLNVCSMFPGMVELAQELHGLGYTLAMNTSASTMSCVPMLEKCGLGECFDFMGTVEVDRSKVKKFNLIKEKYSVAGSEMVFVTDTLGDLIEAKEAGVPTLVVMWGMHDRSYFTRETHDNLVAIVDTVAELREKILESVKI